MRKFDLNLSSSGNICSSQWEWLWVRLTAVDEAFAVDSYDAFKFPICYQQTNKSSKIFENVHITDKRTKHAEDKH